MREVRAESDRSVTVLTMTKCTCPTDVTPKPACKPTNSVRSLASASSFDFTMRARDTASFGLDERVDGEILHDFRHGRTRPSR